MKDKALLLCASAALVFSASSALAQAVQTTTTVTTKGTTIPVANIPVTGSPVAGSTLVGATLVGATLTELRDVKMGLSARKQAIGRDAFSDSGDKIGTFTDIIVEPDRGGVSYGIFDVSAYVSEPKLLVAIPVTQLRLVDGRLTVPGATRATLKSMPSFDYTPGS